MSRSDAWLGGVSLAAIVLLSLFVVMMAANRPSLLSPVAHANFYPHWMAGPLGGLLPGLTRSSKAIKYLFSGSVVVMYVGYLTILARAPRLPVRWVLGAILAVHVIFVLAPPLALTDLFNYVNYGRMEVVHNLNPYTSIPILEPHSDPSFALSNWHELLSPYGPLFTYLTFAVVPLGVAGSFWALKVVLALSSLSIIALVWHCAKLLGRNQVRAVAIVGLNPVVLVWGLGGDHNDFLMVLFIMLGFYLLLVDRLRVREAPAHEAPADEVALSGWHAWRAHLSAPEIFAGAAFVTAAAIKASGAVLIPVVLASVLRRRRALWQVLGGMVVAGILLGALSVAAFGLHVPDLSTQSKLVTGESLPNLLGLAIGAGGESETLHHLLSGVLVLSVLGCCWIAYRAGDASVGVDDDRAMAAAGWASIALLVTLSWVLPWYVLWVLPLTALSSSKRLRRASLVFGAYLIIAWAPASGLLWNAIGFHPENTSLGRLHQRIVRELLNF
ncbi:MAG TPA: hypothetical protein VGG08_05915 [Solirubrobacteraceae bacterium]